MRTLVFVSALMLSIMLSIGHAHQQKEAYISLLFNQRTGNMEISHRFLLHDAEHGLSFILKGAGDLSADELTQQRFFDYIQQHFKVRDNNNSDLSLKPVGYEVEGKYFWVYQESEIPGTKLIKLKHSALHELWPSQTNHINIEKDGWVKSLRLQKEDNDHWHSISLSNE